MKTNKEAGEKPRAKCRPKKGSFCTAMEASLDEANTQRKGLYPVVLTDLKTFESRMKGICYQRRAGKPNLFAVFFNFCPWCGVDISPKAFGL